MSQFTRGDKVRWASQAGGRYTEKEGTIIEVCREPAISLTKQTTVNILREIFPEVTIAAAKDKANWVNQISLLEDKYKLKFEPWNMRQDTPHYLVEVDRGKGRKPLLYHPPTEKLQAVK